MNHADKICLDDCLIDHKLLKHNNIVINRSEQCTGQNHNCKYRQLACYCILVTRTLLVTFVMILHKRSKVRAYRSLNKGVVERS